MTERADRKFRRLAAVVTALVVPVGVAAGALTAVAAPGIALSGLSQAGAAPAAAGAAAKVTRSPATLGIHDGAINRCDGSGKLQKHPTNAELIKSPATSYPVYGVFKAASN